MHPLPAGRRKNKKRKRKAKQGSGQSSRLNKGATSLQAHSSGAARPVTSSGGKPTERTRLDPSFARQYSDLNEPSNSDDSRNNAGCCTSFLLSFSGLRASLFCTLAILPAAITTFAWLYNAMAADHHEFNNRVFPDYGNNTCSHYQSESSSMFKLCHQSMRKQEAPDLCSELCARYAYLILGMMGTSAFMIVSTIITVFATRSNVFELVKNYCGSNEETEEQGTDNPYGSCLEQICCV